MDAYLTLLAACLCTIAVLAVRWALLEIMRRNGGEQLASSAGAPLLTPAELAYLAKSGDMSHTMMVLIVDMIQRSVKSKSNGQPTLGEPYEKAVADNVKQFIQHIAERKAGHLIPVKSLNDPIQWLLRIRAIKTFFGETLRAFVGEFLKDPLQIKRHFSWSGVMRFTLDLSTSTTKEAVKAPLHAVLMQKGMLVGERKKSAFSAVFAIGAIALLIGFVIAVHTFLPVYRMRDLIICAQLGLLNAVVIRAVLAIPLLVPSYEELQKIAADLPRQDLRMHLLRQALHWVALIVLIWAIALVLVLGAFELLLDTAIKFMSTAEMIPLVLAATVIGLVAVQLLIDARGMAIRDQPSAAALKSVKWYHAQVAQTRPLSELKNMLSDSNYDPLFSNVLAIYGLETLWFLG